MTANPITQRAQTLLRSIGITDVDLVRETYDASHFGDGEAVLKVGHVLLRFLRDRGQEFLELASVGSPEEFHPMEDVEVALNRRALEEVLGRREVEPLDGVVRRFSEMYRELDAALSGSGESPTMSRIRKASKAHGDAIEKRYRP